MKTKGWKRFVCCACLTAFTAFTYQAAAAARPDSRAPGGQCMPETFLRGNGLVSFGGYDLNITFTPEGRFVRFDITTKKG
jgi:hypothetical protein